MSSNFRLLVLVTKQLAVLVVIGLLYATAITGLIRHSSQRVRENSALSCIDMLGWSCSNAWYDDRVCQFASFSNSTLAVECPGNGTDMFPVDSFNVERSSAEVMETLCDNVCGLRDRWVFLSSCPTSKHVQAVDNQMRSASFPAEISAKSPVFWLSNNIFSESKYPKNIYFNFENRSTADASVESL